MVIPNSGFDTLLNRVYTFFHQPTLSTIARVERGKMSLQIEIPDTVAQALRLPLPEQKQQLLIELALALYARDILAFGKARELTGLSKYEFGLLLGRRGIPRHYGAEELEDDIAYARG